MTAKELKELYYKAHDLQKFIDQYEVAEAKAKLNEEKENKSKAEEKKQQATSGVVPDPKSPSSAPSGGS